MGKALDVRVLTSREVWTGGGEPLSYALTPPTPYPETLRNQIPYLRMPCDPRSARHHLYDKSIK